MTNTNLLITKYEQCQRLIILISLLVPSPQAKNQMQSGLLLNIVVGEGPAILELLASKDQPLLIWGDTLLVLDLGLDILDGVGGLDLKGDGLASEGLDEDLHTTTETKYKVES